MISVSMNAEITEYQEKFFLGLSLRQLACFGAAGALAIGTTLAGTYLFHMNVQVISYVVMLEVTPFLGLGFIKHNGYPFEKLVRIYWRWYSRNSQLPIGKKERCRKNDCKKERVKGKNGECQNAFQLNKQELAKRAKTARKEIARAKKEWRKEERSKRKADQRQKITS